MMIIVSGMGLHYDQLLATAIKASQRAGDIIRKSIGTLSDQDVDSKQAADYVTRVDRESEEAIVEIIHQEYPDHAILGEESHKESGGGGYRWIIDPLDGTTNFIHSYPVFSVSIAVEENGSIVSGVIYDPTRKDLFTAVRGQGAFLNNEKLKVSSLLNKGRALVTTGFPFRQKGHIDNYLKLFKNILLETSDLRRAGSAALDLAYLAAGRCDGFFEIGLSPWDIAAGSLMIQEAGGIVSDFGGGNDYLKTGNIVAGTPLTHPLLLEETMNVFKGIIDK